jgi:apolipoprotein N-acyltransferase
MPDRANVRSYGWLLAAAATTFLMVPSIRFPPAAWLGPVFMLRFVRQQPPLRGCLVAAVVSAAAGLLVFREVYPVGGTEYVAIFVIGSIVGQLVFLTDRLLAPRLGGLAATLVLPAAATALDFLLSYNGNVGTFSSPAYSQVDNLPLLQVAAVAGIWPITFLIFWFATVVNAAWERGWQLRLVRAEAFAFGGALLLILAAGGARLAFAPPAERMVRTAAIGLDSLPVLEAAYAVETGSTVTLSSSLSPSSPEVQTASAGMDTFWQDPEAPAVAPIREAIADLAEREALAGARIVAWSEANAWLPRAEEAAFVERAGAVARATGAYLVLGLLVVDPATGQAENKVVALDPAGAVAFEYHKSKPAPGETTAPGDGRLPFVDTPYGRLSAAICWDADFPALVRQAGQQDVDLLVVPSGDWQAITPWHARIAAVRGVENGLSILRPVRNGLLLASDPFGRPSATLSFFADPEPVLVANLATTGQPVLYPRLGDWFGWLCALGVAAVVLRGAVARLAGKRMPSAPAPAPAGVVRRET